LSDCLFLHDLRLPQVELYFRFLSDFADLRQPKVVSFFSIFARMWQPQVGPNAHCHGTADLPQMSTCDCRKSAFCPICGCRKSKKMKKIANSHGVWS